MTEADSGGEVRVGGETQRFSICLDESKHPLAELVHADCPFFYVSNLSMRGSGSFPIGFEVTAAGTCTVTDRDFHVRIVTSEGDGPP